MMRHLSGVMIAALAASTLFAAPASADHRPGNVVVMGGTISQTGRFVVQAGRQLKGRKLYVDELNARGGLLGHKVEFKIYDDKSDRRSAIELYEKLITEDKVDLIFGPYGSGRTDAMANVTERYKRPFIANATNPLIYQRGRKYIFSSPTPYARDRSKSALHVAKKIGVKRIAIISWPGRTSLLIFTATQVRAKKLGLEVVLAEKFRRNQKDFTALLRRIEASGAEAIISQSRLQHQIALLRQLRELNINVKMFAALEGPSLPGFIEELGSTAEYVVGYTAWEPKPALGHPGIAEFIENYEKRYGEKPNYHAAEGYADMQITEAAVKRAGSFDPEKVRDTLASMTMYTIRGLYKPNERGVGPSTEPLAIQIQNGKRLIVWPAHQAEAKALPMPKWEDRAKK